MTDSRIQACIYAGTHNPITDGWRHPFSPIVEAGMVFDRGTDVPATIPYFLIYRCRACNMEERRSFGLSDSASAANKS